MPEPSEEPCGRRQAEGDLTPRHRSSPPISAASGRAGRLRALCPSQAVGIHLCSSRAAGSPSSPPRPRPTAGEMRAPRQGKRLACARSRCGVRAGPAP